MNNSFYNDFAARFAAGTLTSLVESFNNQVGKRGFNSARAAYDQALIDDLCAEALMCRRCSMAQPFLLLIMWSWTTIAW